MWLFSSRKADFYASGRPTPSDVLFIVEVSDSTLRRDRNIKLPRFAAFGIPEVWIEDLKHDLILVFRDPEGSQYRTQFTLHRGDSISPLAFPKSTFRVDDLIGEEARLLNQESCCLNGQKSKNTALMINNGRVTASSAEASQISKS